MLKSGSETDNHDTESLIPFRVLCPYSADPVVIGDYSMAKDEPIANLNTSSRRYN
ncbi:conserved protein of unknown function [Limnospira indica PCC 8005]|uniref:Uncharacterized protein n=1 Tax=Limnospira indica PCC 8005 TaxID=376219 RepID=A0A9P1KEG5_9CYAN|nr:conserved protein of unknown function [Limnospira indica PCC 8005]